MITLTREEAQQVLDALDKYGFAPLNHDKDWQDFKRTIELLRARLSAPEPEREQGDMPCIEDDGCPTEKAVLQRFWRKHRQPEPEPVALEWDDVFDAAASAYCRSEASRKALRLCFQTRQQTTQVSIGWTANELMAFAKTVAYVCATEPQREWQGLTETEKEILWDEAVDGREHRQPEPEPVAWIHRFIEGGISVGKKPVDLDKNPDRWMPVYRDPTPCQTCEALARTVMMDQTYHDNVTQQREFVGLTDEEISAVDWKQNETLHDFARAIEAKLKEKNT